MLSMTLARAREIIAACEREASVIDQPMNIAVCDAGGNLVAHARMDGAWMGSVDISIKKAWTAVAFDCNTEDLANACQPGQDFFGIHASNGGKVMIFAGGVVVRDDGGDIIGGIGVSGGSGVQDQQVAEAGVNA